MMATLFFLALFLLGLLLALRPLLGPKEPFPEPPRREELLRELEVLKEEVEALEGRKRSGPSPAWWRWKGFWRATVLPPPALPPLARGPGPGGRGPPRGGPLALHPAPPARGDHRDPAPGSPGAQSPRRQGQAHGRGGGPPRLGPQGLRAPGL